MVRGGRRIAPWRATLDALASYAIDFDTISEAEGASSPLKQRQEERNCGSDEGARSENGNHNKRGP